MQLVKFKLHSGVSIYVNPKLVAALAPPPDDLSNTHTYLYLAGGNTLEVAGDLETTMKVLCL